MKSDDKSEPNGKTGKRLTILSIDGGGVRGVIPAKILEVLEGHLERVETHLGSTGKHHLWEYFDMIAGTSSGGLITAMITTPKVKGSQVPRCNASEVVAFFKKDATTIFPETFTDKCCLRWLWEGIKSVFKSIYSARPLEDLLRDTFGEALLSGALTSVIIPAFDTHDQFPVFFSNLKGVDEANPLYNVYVKDACRATTAVPILFPPASFKEQPGRSKVFNVIDGGIAVNDPTLVAVTQAIVQERQAIALDEQEIKGQVSEEKQQAIMQERSRDCTDFRNVLVLSLGTGQHPMRFLANPHWSSVQWLLNRSGSPLLSSFLSASEDMVEYYTSMIFDVHQSRRHYLRIQVDELSESEVVNIDDAGEKNLKRLEDDAAQLVQLHDVSRRDFARRKREAITDDEKRKAITDYGKALSSFAWLLVKERYKLSKEGEIKLQEKFGRTRRRSPPDEKEEPNEPVPSTAGAVQTAVGGCCLLMGAVILVFVGLAVCLLQVTYGVAGF